MGANPLSAEEGKKGRMCTPPTTPSICSAKIRRSSFRLLPKLSA